jgi:predicted acyl esterase
VRQQPIQFTSGTLLTGTLVLPDGPGPFPTVILLSGSGPTSRWSPVWGAPLFLTMAVHLADAGIAVLVYDKRGVAESQGDWRKATLHEPKLTKEFVPGFLACITQFIHSH